MILAFVKIDIIGRVKKEIHKKQLYNKSFHHRSTMFRWTRVIARR